MRSDPTEPTAARQQQVEAIFPEAYETLSTAIRQLAELRSEVSRLRASTYLFMLSGGETTRAAATPAPRLNRPPAASWVRSDVATRRPPVADRPDDDPQLDDDSFDWAAWIQRLPPIRPPKAVGPSPDGPGTVLLPEHN